MVGGAAEKDGDRVLDGQPGYVDQLGRIGVVCGVLYELRDVQRKRIVPPVVYRYPGIGGAYEVEPHHEEGGVQRYVDVVRNREVGYGIAGRPGEGAGDEDRQGECWDEQQERAKVVMVHGLHHSRLAKKATPKKA